MRFMLTIFAILMRLIIQKGLKQVKGLNDMLKLFTLMDPLCTNTTSVPLVLIEFIDKRFSCFLLSFLFDVYRTCATYITCS